MHAASEQQRHRRHVEDRQAQELHPSDQVRGYTEYCRRFHSAVADHGAAVHGCVLFTRDSWCDAYTAAPNEQLAADYPLFTTAKEDVERSFPAYFQDRLTTADDRFAQAFEAGRYRQDRGFVAQIGAQILDPKAHVFELLDNQRKAFTLCRATIDEALCSTSRRKPAKRVVIIEGPPGSGKSVIAARLWASLVTDRDFPEGDVVFATTSMSQNKNWGRLFEESAGVKAASGVLRKTTSYSPISTQRLGSLRKKHGDEFLEGADQWREHRCMTIS